MSVNIAIIGAGRIAWLLEKDPLRYKPCTHAGALRALAAQKRYQQFNFSAIIDPNLKRAQGLRDFLRLPHLKAAEVSTSMAALKDHPPEIIVIAASSGVHYPLFKQALALHPRHIVIEKPVAINASQARRMQTLAQAANTLVWPNYERRFHPKYRYWKKNLTHKLGTLLGYRGLFLAPNTELFPNERWEGVLLHDTTHLLDLVQFFFGPITSHHADFTTTRHRLNCQHLSGISGELTTIANSRAFHLELEIIGSKGRVTLGNGFTRWEPVRRSKFYSRFCSLATAQLLPEKPVTTKNNPFLQLYRQILSHTNENLNNEYFFDACANVQILAEG